MSPRRGHTSVRCVSVLFVYSCFDCVDMWPRVQKNSAPRAAPRPARAAAGGPALTPREMCAMDRHPLGCGSVRKYAPRARSRRREERRGSQQLNHRTTSDVFVDVDCPCGVARGGRNTDLRERDETRENEITERKNPLPAPRNVPRRPATRTPPQLNTVPTS